MSVNIEILPYMYVSASACETLVNGISPARESLGFVDGVWWLRAKSVSLHSMTVRSHLGCHYQGRN